LHASENSLLSPEIKVIEKKEEKKTLISPFYCFSCAENYLYFLNHTRSFSQLVYFPQRRFDKKEMYKIEKVYLDDL
jgi:hypothetical protein